MCELKASSPVKKECGIDVPHLNILNKMEKRNYRRIPARLQLRFPSCNTFNLGTLTNLSANGMYIKAEMSFPMKSTFAVFVHLKNEILKVRVKIVRLVKSGDFYEGMGVRILNQPKRYIKLLMALNGDSHS